MPDIKLPLTDIPDGGAKVIPVDERLNIAVFRVGDRVAAIADRCPHAGASLGTGPFDGTIVKCPLHGFRVDVWKGVGNAGKPVKKFAVTIADGEVCVTVPPP